MKQLAHFTLVFIGFLLLGLTCLHTPAEAVQITQCDLNQESFEFELPNYHIEHQGEAMLDIKLDYRYVDNPELDPNVYPDFVPIAKKVDQFLANYPNETDYWEIVNRKLTKFLLNEYPTLSSIKTHIDIYIGSSNEFYPRSSIVTLTRENSCPLTN